MKRLSRIGKLTKDSMLAIMSEEKKSDLDKVTFPVSRPVAGQLVVFVFSGNVSPLDGARMMSSSKSILSWRFIASL